MIEVMVMGLIVGIMCGCSGSLWPLAGYAVGLAYALRADR